MDLFYIVVFDNLYCKSFAPTSCELLRFFSCCYVVKNEGKTKGKVKSEKYIVQEQKE
jgi:hypothetical protein